MSGPARADASAALAAAAEIGEFFALASVAAPARGWRPLSALLEDEDVLRERVEAAREMLAQRAGVALAEIDERATASIQHLGTVARLLSPVLGATVLTGLSPALEPHAVAWRPMPAGPVAFALTDLAAGTLAGSLESTIVPLGHAFADTFHLSPQIISGNVASALAGAAGMLGRLRPGHADRARTLARDLLTHPYLAGSGSWPDDRAFRRNNCCLFYRIPGGGTCGDCVLTPA